jgi:hypothetical protein
MVQSGNIVSVREVQHELTLKFNGETIERLMKQNKDFFSNPSKEELEFITQIYSIAHSRQNLERKKLLQGGYFADPFIIAKAWKTKGTVITEENIMEHAAKIPNICQHFKVPCEKLEGFLIKEDWKF